MNAKLSWLCVAVTAMFAVAVVLAGDYEGAGGRKFSATGSGTTADPYVPVLSATLTGSSVVTGSVAVTTLPNVTLTPGTAITNTNLASENMIGAVVGKGDVITVTLLTDTNAYTAGDVLADTAAIPSAMRTSGGNGYIHSVHILDEDDQKAGMELIFFDAASSLGTFNGAPNITDTLARNIIGRVSVTTTDYLDLGGASIATKTGLALPTKASGTTSLYVGAITLGTPTHTASGLKVKIGVDHN